MATVSAYRFSQLDPTLADERAESVIDAALAEADQIRAQAHAEGFAAGRGEAHAAFVAEASPALTGLADAARGVNAVSDELCDTLASQSAELALAIAEQILSAAVSVDPSIVANVCRGALRRISDRQRITVLANPEDLELLSAGSARMSVELGGIDRFEVHADRRIDRGGVIVRTDQGEIDATFATQLSQAREIVVAALTVDPEADDAEDVDAVDLDDPFAEPALTTALRTDS